MLEIFKSIGKVQELSLGLNFIDMQRVANISDFPPMINDFFDFKKEETSESEDSFEVPIYTHKNIIIAGSGKIFVTNMTGDDLKKFILKSSCVAFLESSLGDDISLLVYDAEECKLSNLIREFANEKNKARWLHDGKWKEYIIKLDEDISKKIKEKEEEIKKEKEILLKNNYSKLEKMF